VVGSVLVGVMVLFILVSQKQFEMLLYKMMPRSAIHKLRRY
jgi:predicted PurR-regulated permease PerM